VVSYTQQGKKEEIKQKRPNNKMNVVDQQALRLELTLKGVSRYGVF
jgi:hypothetical protein